MPSPMPSSSRLSLSRIVKLLEKRSNLLYETLFLTEDFLQSLDMEFFRVCIFGSARIQPTDPDYHFVESLSYACASCGMDIVTGGGPGLMEAANKGAKRARLDGHEETRSIGLPIDLPFEEPVNAHLDIKRQHRRFSSRLDDFLRISHALVVTPGGIGTLLELTFSLQLLQVGHVSERPVILVNRNFWKGFVRWLNAEPIRRGLISENDLSMLYLVNALEEVLEIVQKAKREFDKKKQSS